MNACNGTNLRLVNISIGKMVKQLTEREDPELLFQHVGAQGTDTFQVLDGIGQYGAQVRNDVLGKIRRKELMLVHPGRADSPIFSVVTRLFCNPGIPALLRLKDRSERSNPDLSKTRILPISTILYSGIVVDGETEDFSVLPAPVNHIIPDA